MSMLFKRYIWPGCLALLFVVSLGLIAYGGWLFQVERGNQALQKGDGERAAEIYQTAQTPFNWMPWLSRVMIQDYSTLLFNHVGTLYADGRYDEAGETLEAGANVASYISDTGDYAFWAGNVQLRRATLDDDPQMIMKNFRNALAVYRNGLEIEPDDWDLKYNYELVQRALAGAGQDDKKQEKVKSILEKMRPQGPQKRELPLEKRS